jgi:hypothetical protein
MPRAKPNTSAIASLSTVALGERDAAAELVAQAPLGSDGFTVLFCSTHYELTKLGEALYALGQVRVAAAVTSRAIGRNGFITKGITGFHLPAGRFKVADALIESTAQFGLPEARALVGALRGQLQHGRDAGLPHLFGMLLVDAEPRCEERLIATLGMELGGVSITGGSAGDVYFNPTGQRPGAPRILHGRRALRGAAVFSLVACEQPVLALSHHHYAPGRRRLVITKADPERRLVREINGRNALEVYTAACSLKAGPHPAEDFASYPLMMRIGNQHFARGMQRVYGDGTLEFACAMEPGLVVTVAQPGDMVACLREMFTNMRGTIGKPELVIGFECAARTAYMEQRGLTGPIAELFESHKVVGFATLGEQFNTIHANNSFTCLGVSAPR